MPEHAGDLLGQLMPEHDGDLVGQQVPEHAVAGDLDGQLAHRAGVDEIHDQLLLGLLDGWVGGNQDAH